MEAIRLPEHVLNNIDNSRKYHYKKLSWYVRTVELVRGTPVEEDENIDYDHLSSIIRDLEINNLDGLNLYEKTRCKYYTALVHILKPKPKFERRRNNGLLSRI